MEDSPEQLCELASIDFEDTEENRCLANIQAERKQVEQDVLTIANRIKLLRAEDARA